jgi:signal transduction histidine kinase
MVASFLAVIYIQNDLINVPYRKQMIDSTIYEQNLKKDIDRKDIETKVQLEKNMLVAENRILEERAQLSQTLHDKLGHNINGSIYQLEAAKVLIDNDPSRSKEMIGGVTDQLRSGMDEIRAILRKERPEKKKLAMLRVYDLCEDCNSKGVEANLTTEGDTGLITDMQWETILDNAFEAVSNSMKYAGCKHIDISILVLNKMIRCTIKDDGKGCKKLVDGMGIAGMRQRMRDIRGILNFATECGFTINMLIPMEGEVNG